MAVTDVGVNFEFKGGDKGRSEMDRTGDSYRKLHEAADQVSKRLDSAHTGLLGGLGRFHGNLKAKAAQIGESFATLGSRVNAHRAMWTAGGAALLGGGLLGAPMALALSRAPIDKELSKNLAAGLTAAENQAIQALGGKLTSQIPYLTMQNWLEGSRDIYRVFRDQSMETRGALGETAAEAARVMDMTVGESAEILVKFNEAFGRNVTDKKAFAEKTYAQISQAYKASPQLFNPKHLSGALGIAPQLHEAGWKSEDFLTAMSVLGPAGNTMLSRMAGPGVRKLGELAARTNQLWTKEETIEGLKNRGTPAGKQQAEFYDKRNKKLADQATQFMRSQMRRGPTAVFGRIGEIQESLKQKFPEKWEDIMFQHLGIRAGEGMSELMKAIEYSKSGLMKQIKTAIRGGDWGQVKDLLGQMDQGIDAKWELLVQRGKKFSAQLGEALKPIVTKILDWAGEGVGSFADLFSANMKTVQENVRGMVEGFSAGMASVAGLQNGDLTQKIKDLIEAPDPTKWKEWGEGAGKAVGEFASNLKTAAEAMAFILKAIAVPIRGYQGFAKEVLPDMAGVGAPADAAKMKADLAWAGNKLWRGLWWPGTPPGTAAAAPEGATPAAAPAEPERVLPGMSRLGWPAAGLPDVKVESRPDVTVNVNIDGRQLRDFQKDYLVSENARARRGAGDNALGFGVP